MEIERKFLVAEPPELDDAERIEIEQGYLTLADDGGAEVRLRRAEGEFFLTVKGGEGRTRVEEEVELDRERFESLWPLTECRRVAKTRHVVPHGDLDIELDVYAGELDGLQTAGGDRGRPCRALCRRSAARRLAHGPRADRRRRLTRRRRARIAARPDRGRGRTRRPRDRGVAPRRERLRPPAPRAQARLQARAPAVPPGGRRPERRCPARVAQALQGHLVSAAPGAPRLAGGHGRRCRRGTRALRSARRRPRSGGPHAYGERLFAEKPKRFVKRLERYWDAPKL